MCAPAGRQAAAHHATHARARTEALARAALSGEDEIETEPLTLTEVVANVPPPAMYATAAAAGLAGAALASLLSRR